MTLLLILLALAAWRVLAAAHLGMELYADEAQYWTWSLAPDWGYYSKPPMVAWAIWLGTHLFGDGELGVRALSVLVYPLTAWLLFLFVRRLFRADPRAEAMAFWTGVVYATLPFVSLGAWLITTDAFLILFWTLSLYLLGFALDSGRWRDWLLLGLAIGLGLMSKYSMVFFGLGLAAYLAIAPERRRLFLDPRPYGAAAVALLMLLPNVLWNAGHQFVSYAHTAEISQLDRALFHPAALLEFVVGQFAVFGPLTFAGLLVIAARPKTWLADDRLRLLAAFTLAPLAAFLGLALLSRAFANWAAFAYAAGTALVCVTWFMQGKRRWLIAAVALHLAAAAAIYHAHDLTGALDIQLGRKTDPYGRVTGYRALGAEVAKRLQAMPDARLLGNDRKLFALMRYYARPYGDNARYLNPTGGLDNHYALTADLRDAPRGVFLLVSEDKLDAKLPTWFAEVVPQPPIEIRPYPDYLVTYRVWRVRDYRGP
ncbi:MAG: glycosyltransferase family 39 protein [Thiobacillus sp.]|nr:glycosyltransferase family 39 protein [Thiobacillus sp.]